MEAVDLGLYVSYSQIAVCDPGELLNMWTAVHVDQGFSWRMGSVSFRTLREACATTIRVGIAKEISIPVGTVRAISVPYSVGTEGVEIGSVTEAVPVRIAPGNYELVFVAIRLESTESYELQFVPNSHATPRILAADVDLLPPENLCMEAEPAV